MKFIKDFLYDFKYMSKQAKSQVIIIGAVIIIGVGGLIVYLFNNKKDKVVNKIDLDLNTYIAYSYQDNGEIQVFNLNENKVVSKLKVGDIKQVLLENKDDINKTLSNPYKLVDKDNKIYALDFNGNIVVFEYTQKDIKEVNRIKIDKLPVDFKIIDNNVYVSYLNSNKIDVINLSNGEKIRTFEATSNVNSFELVDSYLYIGIKEGIEILNTTDITDKNIIELDEESISTEIFVSNFKEDLVINETTTDKTKDITKKKVTTVYVLNNFASDNKSSIVIKFQEGKPVDLVELKKENPVNITENEKFLFVSCKGLEEHNQSDNIIVINKNNFKLKNKISTSDKPNSLTHLDENIIYVGHDSGDVSRINLENEDIEGSYTIANTKGLVIKKYKK